MKKTVGLLLLAGLCALMLSGCGDEAGERVLKPVPFGEHDRCHLCGMVISHYEGPKAEIILKGAEETPLKFCSGRDAFTFALQPENQRRLLAFYIHDLGATSWETPDDKALIAAKDAHYVYGHRREGVMGAEPAAFGRLDAAKAFAAEWGGKTLEYADITLSRLESQE